MVWFLYIIKNETRNKIYIGSTNDLERRVNDHNRGNTPSTKRFVPWCLVYFEKYNSRTEALKREKQLKKWKNRERIENLIRISRS